MKKLILLFLFLVSFISSAQVYSTFFVVPRAVGGDIYVTVDVVGLYNKCYGTYGHHGYYYNIYATSASSFNLNGNFYFSADSANTTNNVVYNSVNFNSGNNTFVSLNNQLAFNNTLDDKIPILCESSDLSRFVPIFLRVDFWSYDNTSGEYYFGESKPLGIVEDSISVYPTIVEDKVMVKSEIVVIYSILGEIKDVIILENGKGKVSLLLYPKGIYLINGIRVIKI